MQINPEEAFTESLVAFAQFQGSESRALPITPHQFAAKWSISTLKERSASQEHFIDLCRMLGEPTPAEIDPHGERYCFERGAKKTGGGDGWADVWKKGCFAWEYKGKHKNLEIAFAQLQRYAIALENPPLLIVSDMARIEIHTNFTNTVEEVHSIPVAEIGTEQHLKLLKSVFCSPEKLQPGKTVAAITEEAARRFAFLAQVLRDRGGEPKRVAHFLNRILFCLFAQDARLLPPNIVIQLLETGLARPSEANKMLRSLFSTMKKGGTFGTHVIDWFNGNLFDSSEAVPLEGTDIAELLSVARLNWSAIEPSIIGTLFERGLDPGKRAQIGAHYTDPRLIMRIVRPVVIDPLATKWEKAKHEIVRLLRSAENASEPSTRVRVNKAARQVYYGFLNTLADYRVLDPACGSGNFLYLALQALKDLEHRVTLEAEQLGLEPAAFRSTHVGVQCVHGIELNIYAAELARVTVWIGEIQWMLRHGIQPARNPILKSLDTIECRDAILNEDGSEPAWPVANAIIGNPPFLGDKKMLGELGRRYVDSLRSLYKKRVLGGADLVAFWFEKARAQVEKGNSTAAGLVATNSIRGGASRRVLERVCKTLAIFDAWSDLPWINEGAAVRVSLICFRAAKSDELQAEERHLNGLKVRSIYPDLNGNGNSELSGQDEHAGDLTLAKRLPENDGCSFIGTQKSGEFEIPGALARQWLQSPNPHKRPNSDVLKPWANGLDVARRNQDLWIVDFGVDMSEAEAALYEKPYTHVREHVKPMRSKVNRAGHKRYWWRHGETRYGMRRAMIGLTRYIAIPRVSKHRLFAWMDAAVLPDCQIVVITRADDATFGVLHSRFHRLWSLRMGTSLEDRPRYTPTTSFETFPFPEGIAPRDTATQVPTDGSFEAIADAARKLTRLRDEWLNPSEWVKIVPEVETGYPDRKIAAMTKGDDLKKRTLTSLYNENPIWLQNAHMELDAAVALAYGWLDYSPAMPDDLIIARLLKNNLARVPDLFATANRAESRHALSNRQRKRVSDLPRAKARPSAASLERRLAVVCTLVNRLADDRHFGRTKMAKIFYLADATQNLNLETTYYRQAAGPLDPQALYDSEIGLEALAVKHRYLSIEKSNQKITYRRGPKLDEALTKARTSLGSARTAVNKLIDLFRPLDTDQCEIVATLYACWNDRIIDQREVSDNSIVEDFLNAWHESKRRFDKARLLGALEWMRANHLTPAGHGGHTQTRHKLTKSLP